MSNPLKTWHVDQIMPLLRCPRLMDLVPEGHLAHFVQDTVREYSRDLSAIVDAYTEHRGFPPDEHPDDDDCAARRAPTAKSSTRRGGSQKACEAGVDFDAGDRAATPLTSARVSDSPEAGI